MFDRLRGRSSGAGRSTQKSARRLSASEMMTLRPSVQMRRLRLNWRRHTVDEIEAILNELELTGPFWSLR